MNILIQVVGSRGDVQPFIALGLALTSHGHRVRLATHNVFADFVRASGLEFYSIGGDPEQLMSLKTQYMVKNPGLMPSFQSIRGGELTRKRAMVHTILQGCWRSCFEPDEVSGKYFVPDAIIANPPGFAHIHCAQALGIPVHIMFTMPWTPTRAFPHPFSRSKRGEPGSSSNYWSYSKVEYMSWQGLGDIINRWRRRDLLLEALPESLGCEVLLVAGLPHTYCWSPAMVPLPEDWNQNIDICGFFLRPEPVYHPSDRLTEFLNAGPPPIYVGFGSIVIEYPKKLTAVILEACRQAGVRAVISQGWSKLGSGEDDNADVLYMDECPHEWIFKRVSAVVHHGGAGTTACGLYNSRPTVIVPFFGDQFFWGSVVKEKGAGPSPIPFKSLNVSNLAAAIKFCLTTVACECAESIASQMRLEKGVSNAVQSFYRHLPLNALTCDLLPGRVARWQFRCRKTRVNQSTIKLSDEALHVLLTQGVIDQSGIRPLRTKEYHLAPQRWDPLSAGLSSILDTLFECTSFMGGMVVESTRDFKNARQASGNQSAGLAATATLWRGLRETGSSAAKGALIGLPMALTDGFMNLWKLSGGVVDQKRTVTSWKSGVAVGCKHFGSELFHGIIGLAVEPVRGAKEGNVKGLVKGTCRGSIGLVAKPGSAIFGLLAYSSQGVYKSIKSAERKRMREMIGRGRRASAHPQEITTDEEADRLLESFRRKVE